MTHQAQESFESDLIEETIHKMESSLHHAQDLTQLTLSKLFEFILNQAIGLDELHGAGFQVIDEKVIQLSFTDLKKSFFITYQIPAQTDEKSARQGVFTVQSHLLGSADAHIKTTLVDWLMHKTEAESALGNAFLAALYVIDIDWEEQLSHYTGDFIAFNVGQTLRQTKKVVKQAKQKAGVTLQEYLQFEVNLLPTGRQVQHFTRQVNDLTNELSALEARINKLSS